MMTIAPSLVTALQKLPDDATEAVTVKLFANPLLEVLGFESSEIVPGFNTGSGIVDIAARENIGSDLFIQTKANPYLLVEVKARTCNLSPNLATYHSAAAQLKKYLLAPKCHAVHYGILTNSCHIQLFRKHGKTVFPATKCLPINEANIDPVVNAISSNLTKPTKALTVAIYNNKGGVGKTTTTVNIAGILSWLGKKVLVIDFDHNQRDLTNLLNVSSTPGTVFEALTERQIELKSVIRPYRYKIPKIETKVGFDVIPADSSMTEIAESSLEGHFQYNTLYRKLESLKYVYDYILIDAPPNWKLFSKLPIYAADVVLMPTKHNNFYSLQNAAVAIAKFIPEVQEKKADGSPIALPIFFNGEDISEAQLTVCQRTIDEIIDKYKKEEQFNLLSFFYPKYATATQDRHITKVPKYAYIANAAFHHVPAVYQYKIAHDYYKDLVKEYFLQ